LPTGLLALCLGLGHGGLPNARAGETSPPAKAIRILKVLPHYLDKEGHHTVNPSHFDRDAYQFELRRNPDLRSGMRFDVLWRSVRRAPIELDLRLELRGSKAPEQAPVMVQTRASSRGGFAQWTRIPVVARDYEALGELVAWRVSLWRGDELVAEQKSFLW
jgi:hypothetical protein